MDALAVVQDQLARRAGLTSQQSRRWIEGSVGNRADAPLAFAAPCELSQLAQPAAPCAGAGGIRAQLSFFQDDRRKTFDDFGRNSRHTAGKSHRAETIFGRARTGAADLKHRQSKRRVLPAPHTEPSERRIIPSATASMLSKPNSSIISKSARPPASLHAVWA